MKASCPEQGTILVVDDQLGVRRLLREVFRLQGYRVVLASGGREAVGLARRVKPALALLDMRMPGMSGLETLDALRAVDPGLPVVIMTAVNDLEAGQALARGAVRAISKPFDVREVRAMVDEIIRGRYPRDVPAPAQGQERVAEAQGSYGRGGDGVPGPEPRHPAER
ncbi:MAG: response regulator [Acetobacteraceae bacterium]|nr:response regulator [Acetobacteraceae bacterium]